MNEIEKVRTIDDITQEIRELQDQTRRLVLGYAIEVGRRLVEAKDMLSHGEWGDWLRDKVSFSQRTAERCMTLYDAYGAEQIGIFGAEIKSTALTNLSFTNALLLVAVPEEEREEFAAEVDAEHISSRELEQAIRERDEARKSLEDAYEERNAAEEEAATARKELDEAEKQGIKLAKELQELKNRPIEYAVQEPDPEAVKAEVDKALADAEAHHMVQREQLEKKLKALEKKRDKLEQAVKEAEGKADAAKAAGSGEAEGLRVEVERLKKQLSMSDTTTTEYKIVFNSVQRDLGRLLEIIGKAPADVAPKLRKALGALLKTVGDKLDMQQRSFVPQLVTDPDYIPEDID
ncbi:MAG: DUF3102 domain-containing protein, partial [Clostridia bacterium]|nr:DUF3102 domain-containing protein [Clostridia bacterium]